MPVHNTHLTRPHPELPHQSRDALASRLQITLCVIRALRIYRGAAAITAARPDAANVLLLKQTTEAAINLYHQQLPNIGMQSNAVYSGMLTGAWRSQEARPLEPQEQRLVIAALSHAQQVALRRGQQVTDPIAQEMTCADARQFELVAAHFEPGNDVQSDATRPLMAASAL